MFIIGISLAGLSALGFVLYHVRKAPEGYEDERGFHNIIKRAAGSKVMRSPKASGSLASLRSAKASR